MGCRVGRDLAHQRVRVSRYEVRLSAVTEEEKRKSSKNNINVYA